MRKNPCKYPSFKQYSRMNELFYQHNCENKLHFSEMMLRLALEKTNTLSWMFTVLAHWNNTRGIDTDTLIIMILSPTSLCNYSLILCAYRRSCKYKFHGLVLTRPGLKPMIYPTRSEHDNHYTLRINTLGLILLDKLILVLSDRLNDILFVES